MRRLFPMAVTGAVLAACALLAYASAVGQNTKQAAAAPRSFLGFDRNQYPGDASLDSLRRTFSFAGYWLNPPPGETTDTWRGKREVLNSNGFGFLVLFNGRLDRQLKSEANAKVLGMRDGASAVAAAKSEGFPAGTVIFLDQEEGGRMLPEQGAYVYAWIDAVGAAGDRGGVYCSGMPVRESPKVTITTADDLRENSGGRNIAFFVYNDACPPSPGCEFPNEAPQPAQGGVSGAAIWQYAQSPRRPEFTKMCAARYDRDGNCYPPRVGKAGGIYVDVDVATSPDPSSGR